MGRDSLKEGVHIEVTAAKYFTETGCDIFWPLAGFTKSDFIRDDNGTLKRIQVKKVSWVQNNPAIPFRYLSVPLHHSKGEAYKKEDVDEVVLVDEDERIWVIPFEEIEGKKGLILDSTNPDYRPTVNYNPDDWRVR